MYKCTLRNRDFEYNPKMDVEDFVRNNELTRDEQEDMGWIIKTMVDLYQTRLEENYFTL